jgi:hypothetical protein
LCLPKSLFTNIKMLPSHNTTCDVAILKQTFRKCKFMFF